MSGLRYHFQKTTDFTDYLQSKAMEARAEMGTLHPRSHKYQSLLSEASAYENVLGIVRNSNVQAVLYE